MAGNQDTTAEMNFSITQFTSKNSTLFSGRNSHNLNSYGMLIGGSRQGVYDILYSGYNDASIELLPLETNILYNIVKDKNKTYLNNELIFTHTYANFSSPRTIYIFQTNQDSEETFPGYIKLYSFKLYDNGTLVRNFLPVKRKSDNVVGLYDRVSGTFFTNAGTGSFIAGPEV